MAYLFPKYPRNSLTWFNRFDNSKLETTAPEFHYFPHEEPGYQKVTLYLSPTETKNPATTLTLYYQNVSQQQFALLRPDHESVGRQAQKPLDLSYLDGQLNPQTILEENQKLGKDEVISKSLWVSKYNPSKFIELLSDDYVNRKALEWLKSWDPKVFKKDARKTNNNFTMFKNKSGSAMEIENAQTLDSNTLILLGGPPGCGKTTLARVIANHCKYQPIQINASDNRTAKALIERIDQMTSNGSVAAGGKPTMVIIDEVDGMVQREQNGIKEVLNYIQTGELPQEFGKKKADNAQKKKNISRKPGELFINRPIIFICNDPHARCLRELRKKAFVLSLQKVRIERLTETLKEICRKEGVFIQQTVLQKLCQINNNDVRSTLSMLEFLVRCKTESKNITQQDALKKIKWDSKHGSKDMLEFIDGIFQEKTKVGLKELQQSLAIVQAQPNLILETFFHNYILRAPVKRSTPNGVRILEAICYADQLVAKSFQYNLQTNSFLFLPYFLYKMIFRERDNTKSEFPREFFDRIMRTNKNKETLNQFKDELDPKIKPYYTKKSLLLDMIPSLVFLCRPRTASEIDVQESVKLMYSYGLRVEMEHEDFLKPPIDRLISKVGAPKQEAKSIMNRKEEQERDEYLKLGGMLKNMMLKQMKDLENTKNVDHTQALKAGVELKVSKKSQKLHYKFVEGTSTKIKYKLTMEYFFG